LLKAKTSKDFLKKLVGHTKQLSDVKTLTFEQKISGILLLAKLDIEFFTIEGKEKVVSSFSTPFETNKLTVGSHTIEKISSLNDYKIIVAHGIERIVRSFFEDDQERDLIRELIKQKELAESIMVGSIYVPKWEVSKSDESNVPVNLLPFTSTDDGIIVSGEIPMIYKDHTLQTILVFSIICAIVNDSPENTIPIGEYSTINNEYKTENIPPETSPTGFVPYTMLVERNTFKQNKDDSTEEMIYNSLCKIFYPASLNRLKKIEEFVIDNASNYSMTKMSLVLICSMVYRNDDVTKTAIRIIYGILDTLDCSMDDIIAGETFVQNRSLNIEIFCRFLKNLDIDTITDIGSEKIKLKLHDANAMNLQNVSQYLLSEQVRRLKNHPIMDWNIRQLLNKSKFPNKQRILKAITDIVKPEMENRK
jgi:hypothetical protein